jgi:hypothetical protein
MVLDFIKLMSNECGWDPDIDGKFIKHAESGRDLKNLWISGKLELYQSFQRSDVFNCKYIISFIGEGEDKARFLGMYRVLSKKRADESGYSVDDIKSVFAENSSIFYQFEVVAVFEAG